MINECTDTGLREKLLAYELGMLTDDERQELELHLYNCEACFNDIDQFANWSEYLRNSQRIRDSILADSPPATKSRTAITRFVLLTAVIIIIAVPVYKFWYDERSSEIVQQLKLVPVRSQTNNIIHLDRGGTAKIQFVVEGAVVENPLQVAIISRAGDTVYTDENFMNFTVQGKGILELPVDSFEPGFYTLKISDSSRHLTDSMIQYPFKVK